jgi:hypothetical protein
MQDPRGQPSAVGTTIRISPIRHAVEIDTLHEFFKELRRPIRDAVDDHGDFCA